MAGIAEIVDVRKLQMLQFIRRRLSGGIALVLTAPGGALSQVPIGPPSPENPYALTADVVARIDWHNGPGAWGPQVPLDIASPPTTTRSVTVSSLADLQAALGGPDSDCSYMNTGSDAASGVQITLDRSVADPASMVCVFGDNIDLIVPPGVVGPGIEFKDNPSNFRVRGPVPGSCSGGLVGQIRGGADDVIVDSVDVNGNSMFNGSTEGHSSFRPGGTRWVVNCVASLSEAYGWLGGASHVLIKDSNFICGVLTEAQLSPLLGHSSPGEWCIRNSLGPFVTVNSAFQNDKYVTVRTHSTSTAGELAAFIDSWFLPVGEGRAHWAWPDAATGELGPGQSTIIDGGGIWAYSACGGWPEIMAVDGPGNRDRAVDHLRISNVDFRSAGSPVYDQAFLDRIAADMASRGGVADVDSANGNRFSNWASYSAPWAVNGAGDPTTLPLPTGLSISYGDGDCVGFPDA